MGDESKFLGILPEAATADTRLPVVGPPVAGGRDSRLPMPSAGFLASKRVFDIFCAIAAAPLVLLIGLALVVANPLWNRGPLIFVQQRMGRNCRPFMAYKFRTMACDTAPPGPGRRGPNDPVETHRITPLGRWLRQTRIDEFPQFFNVLIGEMSLIGPRPDQWDHARHFAVAVPGYRDRHRVRPGITGLAQIYNGYAEGEDATVAKTRADLTYISTASWRNETRIMWRTVRVMLTGFGAR